MLNSDVVLVIETLDLGFVSSFGFRISDCQFKQTTYDGL
jgi:hypothetical protein